MADKRASQLSSVKPGSVPLFISIISVFWIATAIKLSFVHQETKNLTDDLGIVKSSTIPLTTWEKQNREDEEEEDDDEDDDDEDDDDVDAESHVMDTSFTSAGTMEGGKGWEAVDSTVLFWLRSLYAV